MGWWVSERAGKQGRPGRGGEGRTLSGSSSLQVRVSAASLPRDRAGSLVLARGPLTQRRGWPGGGPVDGRLLHFFRGVSGWKEARNPSLSETAAHPTV